jgi:hypothetical protein
MNGRCWSTDEIATLRRLVVAGWTEAWIGEELGRVGETFQRRIRRQTLPRRFGPDPRKFFHADGTPKKVHELGDDEAAALSGFEATGEAGKVVDRLKVLELLGRHFGLWVQKPPPPPPQDVNLFEGMSLDDVRRVRDKVGRLLGGAGVDLPGSAPRRRPG